MRHAQVLPHPPASPQGRRHGAGKVPTAMSDAAPISTETSRIIDFHNHFVGPTFTLTTLAGVPPGQRAFWDGVNRQLADPAALLASIDAAGVDARVVSTPLEFLA